MVVELSLGREPQLALRALMDVAHRVAASGGRPAERGTLFADSLACGSLMGGT